VAEWFARRGAVRLLRFDAAFRSHLASRATYAKHRVSIAEIAQVHGGQPQYFLNMSKSRAPIIMVRPTPAGRWLCVPIAPTRQQGVWRPVTAFEANTHHIRWYQQGGQP
jgi:hypothetical protein